MNVFTRKAASVAALTVLGITAGGIAWAETSSSPAPSAVVARNTVATPDAAPDGAGFKGRMHGLGGRMLHGEFVVKTRNGFVTMVVARGTVAAISGSSISVKSADGVTTTFAIDAKTKARSAGKLVAISAVHQGDTVGVAGVKNGTAVVAKLIRERPAAKN